MRKTVVIVTVLAVLGLGAVALAHGGPGWGGYMMGPGMMYGGGYQGGGMMGWGQDAAADAETQEFLAKTSDLRRELNEKGFLYQEALRTGDAKAARKLATEIDELRDKLYAQAPKRTYGMGGGYGYCR